MNQQKTWVNFSGLTATSASKYVRKGHLEFNASGIADGTELNATLTFEGEREENAFVSLKALVLSTPSLHRSTLDMP